MTAEEIRNLNEIYMAALKKAEAPTVNVINGITFAVILTAMLEIAAQLAELNKKLDPANLKELMRIEREND